MKVHGRRALLNMPGYQSTAAIVAEIQDTSEIPIEQTPGGRPIDRHTVEYSLVPVRGQLQISDCTRAIEFDVAMVDSSENTYENTLFKLDTMIEALTEFRRGLKAERKLYLKRQKIRDKLKKEAADEV